MVQTARRLVVFQRVFWLQFAFGCIECCLLIVVVAKTKNGILDVLDNPTPEDTGNMQMYQLVLKSCTISIHKCKYVCSLICDDNTLFG